MNFKHLETDDKLRGGFYTPDVIASMLTKWVLDDKALRVLEPGCGDGAFLRSIYENIKNLHYQRKITIDAVEIIHAEAEKSKQIASELINLGGKVTVLETDFFEWIINKPDSETWDAILGNPPYIRYQYFDKKQRDFAENIFKEANVPFTKRTNAWVPFVIASIMHLSPGGRLAMVLPAEILHVLHADGLRRLLEQEMDVVEIVDVRELAFVDALQGIVLLRAIKKKNRAFTPLQSYSKYGARQLTLKETDKQQFQTEPATFYIHRLNNLGALQDLDEINHNNHKLHVLPYGKWTRWLLELDELSLLNKIEQEKWASPFVNIASVDIGIVTGANKYFVVDLKTAEKFDLLPFSSPMLARSEFIDGIVYNNEDQKENELSGKAVLFVEFPDKPKADLPPKVLKYIELGEEQELHKRYKCRIREPWYVVPYIWISKVSLLKRCHDFPRLVLNEARALSTDTAYRIVMNDTYSGREKDLVFSFLNSLTFLYAELEGRHYGGGVLELVPSEIEILRIPLTNVSDDQFAKVDTLIRTGAGVDKILDYTDPLILGKGTIPNLSDKEIITLRNARTRLKNRRMRIDLDI